jgi:5'-nucleotidase
MTALTPALVAASLALSSCSCPPGGQDLACAPKGQRPAAAPAARGATESLGGHEFTIVGLGDIHGQLEPFAAKKDADGDGVKETVSTGGIARVATLVRSIEAENPGRVAVVFAGDALSDTYFHAFGGRAIYGLMSDAGLEIAVFGNHEFDTGPQALATALRYAEFDRVCSDLIVAATPLDGLCAPFLIEDYDGLEVGYFSLITEGLPYLSSPGEVPLSGTNIETAARAVRELRDRGADLVVALTHIGLDEDVALASAVPGIDVVFGGHSHSYLDAPVRVNDTFVVAGGERGTHLMRLDLATDAAGRIDPRSVRYEMVPVGDAVPGAPDVEAALAAFRDSLPEAVVLGTTEVPWDLSSSAVRGGESPVANLVNDMMREKFGVDVVLNNAGAFRGKMVYEPGPVTDAMLRSIDEFGNQAILLTLDGAHLKEVLERSAACFGEGGLLHASGLRYTIESWRPAQELAQDESGGWAVTAPGGRVSEALVAAADGTWQPIDPARDYRVLTNSFLVNQAGDGYFWFAKYGRDRENTYSTMYSILEELVKREGVLNPQPPDGRLRVEGH